MSTTPSKLPDPIAPVKDAPNPSVEGTKAYRRAKAAHEAKQKS